MGDNPNAHRKRVALLLWLLVTIFYFYLSYDYIRASMNDRTFGQYIQYVVRIAGTERRPAKEVRELILVKANQLSIPLRPDEISVKGIGTDLSVGVNYMMDIEVPLFERVIYTKEFNHEAKYEESKY